jgi:hypothetical protein
MEQTSREGLSWFKRGWATGDKAKYFCGSIFDPEAYAFLTKPSGSGSSYFPAYRAGELS